jgi:mannose/fructose/N-acetylgalactosamine-specific phosphotransferase system component IIC
MLSFLNGGILIALLAVAIPLLIHLINRQNQIKIKFSTLRFLKTIEEKRIKKIKIYQLLLILLRSLIILFLVLSFARLGGRPDGCDNSR